MGIIDVIKEIFKAKPNKIDKRKIDKKDIIALVIAIVIAVIITKNQTKYILSIFTIIIN